MSYGNRVVLKYHNCISVTLSDLKPTIFLIIFQQFIKWSISDANTSSQFEMTSNSEMHPNSEMRSSSEIHYNPELNVECEWDPDSEWDVEC